MRLTEEILEARIECLNECAEHLTLNWTDDPEEIRQAEFIGDFLRREMRVLGRRIDVLRAREKLKANLSKTPVC